MFKLEIHLIWSGYHVHECSNLGFQKWTLCFQTLCKASHLFSMEIRGLWWEKGAKCCSAVGFACRSRLTVFHEDLHNCVSLWMPVFPAAHVSCVLTTHFLCFSQEHQSELTEDCVTSKKQLIFAGKKTLKTIVYVTQKCCSYVQSHICIHPDVTPGLFELVQSVRALVSVRLLCLFIYSRLNQSCLSVCLPPQSSGTQSPATQRGAPHASWVRLHFTDNHKCLGCWGWIAGAHRFLTEKSRKYMRFGPKCHHWWMWIQQLCYWLGSIWW